MAVINGDNNDNTLDGTPDDDTINGLGGNDTINGEGGHNTLNGGDGNDLLISTGSIDTIDGGTGQDFWIGDYSASTANLRFSEVKAGVFNLTGGVSLTSVEGFNLRLGSGDDTVVLKHSLTNNGDDLIPYHSAGMDGGAGNDTLTMTLSPNPGLPFPVTLTYNADGSGVIRTDNSHTLPFSSFETINLTAQNGDDTFTVTGGPSAHFHINGYLGTDSAQVDLSYATAPITFALNNATDAVSTFVGDGSSLENVEWVRLTTGSGDDTLTGGTGADFITSGDGNDVVEGGLGDDHLDGGKGVDTVSYAHAASAVTVDLSPGSASGGEGSDGLLNFENITGSAFDDTLTGSHFANLIDGGAGADVMAGAEGNDTYIVGDPGDVVIENASEGVADTVDASITYALGANVENLVLTGSGDIDGTGNDLKNVITGNGGANVLAGGLGNDTLTGGLGDDTFLFDTAPAKNTNEDTITDFSVTDDTIALDHAVFAALSPGALPASAFHSGLGTVATAAGQHIIYDTTNGAIAYDSDGKGGAASVVFAHVTPGLALTAADFFVV